MAACDRCEAPATVALYAGRLSGDPKPDINAAFAGMGLTHGTVCDVHAEDAMAAITDRFGFAASEPLEA